MNNNQIFLQLQKDNQEHLNAAKYSSLEIFAFQFAADKHKDQKYGDKPYTYHLLSVRNFIQDNLIASAKDKGQLLCAAWLHDCVEDCGVSTTELTELFEKNISDMVLNVSGFGKNRKERTQYIYNNIIASSEPIRKWSATLKIADRYCNLNECFLSKSSKTEMYLKEAQDFEFYIGRYGDEILKDKLKKLIQNNGNGY